MHGYDLGATITAIMEAQGGTAAFSAAQDEEPQAVLVGNVP